MEFISGRHNAVQFSKCGLYRVKRVTKKKDIKNFTEDGSQGLFYGKREWEVSHRIDPEGDFEPKTSFQTILDAKIWAEEHKNGEQGTTSENS
tara:strand:- start:141 stop:416 length:276 start_codon:yes stop_codon:yes gene_type:complete